MSGPWESEDGSASEEGRFLLPAQSSVHILLSILLWLRECFGVFFLLCFHKVSAFVLQFGSAVKLPGSGGAVVGLCLDNAKLVRRHYVAISVLADIITPPKNIKCIVWLKWLLKLWLMVLEIQTTNDVTRQEKKRVHDIRPRAEQPVVHKETLGVTLTACAG